MVIILIGPKGAGKSTIREFLEEKKGYVSVYMEALFQELDPKQEFTVDKPSEELRELVYIVAKDRIIEKSKNGNVVFDGTGTSDRFLPFFESIKKECPQCYLVFIDSDREISYDRTQIRNKAEHRPFTREYFDDIYDKCQSRKKMADFVIANDKGVDDLIGKFEKYVTRTSGLK